MTSSRSITRLVATLGVVAVVAILAFAPAMATFAGDVLAPGEPDAAESLVLEPHPGPNGEYAFLDEAGELEIVAEQVNPETRSAFEDVFTITNNASRAVRLNVSHDSEDVVVFDSNATTEFGAIQTAEGITIPANGTVAVGFHVDSHGAAAGETLLETITFHATWASEDDETSSTPSSESFSVDSGSPTATPTPSPTTDGPDAPAGTDETPTPTAAPDTPEESPSPTETDDPVAEVAGLDGAWLWVLLALGLGAIAAGYAYRRVA